MNNDGKKFEQDFIKSLNKLYTGIRLKDAAGWSKDVKTRFTIKNMCDFIIFDGNVLVLAELKSYKGRNFPLDGVREYQFTQLMAYRDKLKTYPCVIINFRDYNTTYALHIEHIYTFIKAGERKSIPFHYAEKHGILIPQELKRTRYVYNIDNLFIRIGELLNDKKNQSR